MIPSLNTYSSFAYSPMQNISGTGAEVSRAEERALKRAGLEPCQECAKRKYQDGSNESDVSFKAPGHISPQASAATVMSHELEHVSNAYEKAAKNDGQVVRSTVTLQHAICPECGRSYISGGLTNTAIKYNVENPYGASQKTYDEANGAVGSKIDLAV